MSDTHTQIDAQKLFSRQCVFVAGAGDVDSMPVGLSLPEVAFIGRSNVGKSSLINALLGHKIARTSQSPGHTRQLNFFNVNDKLMLVDMPGYGYASAPRAQIAKWKALSRYYLAHSSRLRRLFVLVDSRHGLKQLDIDMLDFTKEYPISTQLILTKSDKMPKNDIIAIMEKTAETAALYATCTPNILCISSKTTGGMDALRTSIVEIL